MDHRAVVDAHVTAFNEGVRTGDFAPMMAGFHHDARLEFRGVAAGPFEGRGSIAEAYRTQPPDDEIDVFDVADRSGTTVVSYGWRKEEGRRGGEMIFTIDDGRIAELVVTFDP